MQEESHNNNMGWKQKLEDLHNDATFNKEAAWDKLYVKIQSEPSRAKSVWYWFAAACLVSIILFSVMVYLKDNRDVKATILNAHPKKYDATMHGIETISITNKILNKEKTFHFNKITEPTVYHKNIIVPVIKSLTVDTVTLYTKNSISQNILPTPDTLSKPALAIVIKKRLPVIHLNEIEETAKQPVDVAHNTSEHSFEFRFGAQEIFPGDATHRSFTSGFIIIKSKTSPN